MGSNTTSTLSGLVEQVVDTFGCRWLDFRSALVDVLPFAGGEILVMKERFDSRELSGNIPDIKVRGEDACIAWSFHSRPDIGERGLYSGGNRCLSGKPLSSIKVGVFFVNVYYVQKYKHTKKSNNFYTFGICVTILLKDYYVLRTTPLLVLYIKILFFCLRH